MLAWLAAAAVQSDFVDFATVRRFQFNRLVLEGLRNTVVLSVLAQAVGIVLGVLFGAMRRSRNPVSSAVAWFYVWLFRGTPVIVQLLFWFNGVPTAFETLSIKVPFVDAYLYREPMVEFMTPFMAAFLGLALNEAAYMTEIVRGAILSVDPGQVRAAQALGMTPAMAMRRIVFPQAVRVIIPATGNEFISMLKTSSLATVVVFPELLTRARGIYSTNLLVMELLVVASIWYIALTSVASVGQYYLERRFARGSAEELAPTPLQRVRRAVFRRPRL
ncbi:MAG: amino acid ABC transporter permease [Actinomycetota bacterium]|nr:amino acid ABC transporter permease [Actinomycetota bacterium]